MEKSKNQKNKVRFVVVREFSGEKSMREAFEQLIERQTCEHFEEWRHQRGNGRKSCVKTVDSGTGTWYYNGIVSLFIEGERYEQEKNKSMKKSPLSTAVFLWMTAATMRA
ncbi:MAG: hypothetical protein ACLU7M_07680 [Mediterraneibacter gnavus]